MIRSSHRLLIDRGRKAGLNTYELYAALRGAPLAVAKGAGQTDGNGFAAGCDERGRAVFKPWLASSES